mmetsp:Transcript_1539/g.2745  ORF Transcript_1539/g.2745 Transcript_1539/m.2745 type:complete len:91 (+) Transcript_1539:63-335(+)
MLYRLIQSGAKLNATQVMPINSMSEDPSSDVNCVLPSELLQVPPDCQRPTLPEFALAMLLAGPHTWMHAASGEASQPLQLLPHLSARAPR